MPDDTPQQMLNAEKRKLQAQALDDPFIAEMKAAEAKGDLPPAEVRHDHMERTEIVGGEEGGETPTQMASMYEERLAKNDADLARMSAKLRTVEKLSNMESVSGNIMRLIGEGKIQLTSPEAQAAAVDLYQDSMKTTGGPHMGVEAEDYRSRDKLRNLEEEFPLKGRVGEEGR